MLGDNVEFIRQVIVKINKVYPCIGKEGMKLNYLNLRIVQSEYCISITEAIREFVKKHYPDGVKQTTLPIHTDKEYKYELQNSPVLSRDKLHASVTEFGRTYNSLYGSLIHFMIWTRVELAYSLIRLGNFQAAPNCPAFEGLHCVIHFLGSYPNRPIFYQKSGKGRVNTITIRWNNNKIETLALSDTLEQVNDASNATIPTDRSTYGGCIHLFARTLFA